MCVISGWGEEGWGSLLKAGAHTREQLFEVSSRICSTEGGKTWSGFRRGAKTSPAHLLRFPPTQHDGGTYGPPFKALVREEHHGEKERPEDHSPYPHSGSPGTEIAAITPRPPTAP